MPQQFINLILISILLINFLSTNSSADLAAEYMAKQDQRYKGVVVQEVIRADMIVIEDYLKKGEKIRLAGIKASELVAKKRPTAERDAHGFVIEEEFSPDISIDERALNFVKQLLEGKKVRLEFDRIKKNEKLETLAYVFLAENNLFVNAEILRQGYASLSVLPLNKMYFDELQKSYQEARREKRGIQSE